MPLPKARNVFKGQNKQGAHTQGTASLGDRVEAEPQPGVTTGATVTQSLGTRPALALACQCPQQEQASIPITSTWKACTHTKQIKVALEVIKNKP